MLFRSSTIRRPPMMIEVGWTPGGSLCVGDCLRVGVGAGRGVGVGVGAGGVGTSSLFLRRPDWPRAACGRPSERSSHKASVAATQAISNSLCSLFSLSDCTATRPHQRAKCKAQRAKIGVNDPDIVASAATSVFYFLSAPTAPVNTPAASVKASNTAVTWNGAAQA